MKVTPQALEGFVRSILASTYDEASGTPDFHRELWDLVCSDNKYVAIAAPRGHAKSTAGTMACTLALTLMEDRKFVVIVSDTETQAGMFLQNIKNEITSNKLIREVFDLKLTVKGEVFLEKDTDTDFIAVFNNGNKFRVIAKGAGQKLRGLLWQNSRPDLVVGDDLENDESVENKERRAKLWRWFKSALLPVISPRGVVRIWGTVLHTDSLLERVMPDEWRKSTIEEGLKVTDPKQKGIWKSVKYRAHNPDFSLILWPQRFKKKDFKKLRDEAVRDGTPDSYSQEYLNNPIDESVAYFKKKDFKPRTKEQAEKRLTYYITGDLAISEKETADHTVFLIAGMDQDRMLHIVDVVRDRLDGRQIVDMILQLHRTFQPEAFGIEEMQVTKAIGPFLREEMAKQGVYPNLLMLKHGGKDKVARGRSIQARMRAKSVVFDMDADWYPVFEDECLKFPRSKWDDQVDAFAYMGMLLNMMNEAATDEEIDEDEYKDELNDSQWNFSGRNATTGY